MVHTTHTIEVHLGPLEESIVLHVRGCLLKKIQPPDPGLPQGCGLIRVGARQIAVIEVGSRFIDGQEDNNEIRCGDAAVVERLGGVSRLFLLESFSVHFGEDFPMSRKNTFKPTIECRPQYLFGWSYTSRRTGLQSCCSLVVRALPP